MGRKETKGPGQERMKGKETRKRKNFLKKEKNKKKSRTHSLLERPAKTAKKKKKKEREIITQGTEIHIAAVETWEGA
ncbi:hypothetical protein Ahy_B01g055142 isoform F [Arachis hypogaea]|uniref:Uncharacterized protein n=1 Tax=Arachis hypogaea TaxID=3818 RepID=A0A445AVA1_ARAHY|nr:hypothetical protein Ahy_B01g055142 isoform F [Arachis hypogaea]